MTDGDIAMSNELDELKKELQTIANSCAVSARGALRDAALSMIAAISYDDETLIGSSFTRLLTAMADIASDAITKDLAESAGLKRGLQRGWDLYINKKAFDIGVFDELKDNIETIIDDQVQGMTKGLKLVSKLEKAGHPVENAKNLEDGIRDLRGFRDQFFKNWPVRKPPSPLDRTAIADAREAIRRGAKGLRKDELTYRGK